MAASDQIVFSARKDRIKEGSRLIVTARFRDRATQANVTPTNVKYRLDCLTTGAAIADWTTATPGTTVAITTTPEQNAIRDQGQYSERKQLTVAADYGLSTQYVETFDYWVESVHGIT